MSKLSFAPIGIALALLSIGMFAYSFWLNIIQRPNNWDDRSYVVMFLAVCCFVISGLLRLRN
jgi:peptidoglycan/LPS O-acetylase OafA/YrhL